MPTTTSTGTCRAGCGQPIDLAYDPQSGHWLPLDAQVVDATDPAVWLVRRGPGRLEAHRLTDLADRRATARGIPVELARAQVMDLYEAHYDHRQVCPVRQHREDRKR